MMPMQMRKGSPPLFESQSHSSRGSRRRRPRETPPLITSWSGEPTTTFANCLRWTRPKIQSVDGVRDPSYIGAVASTNAALNVLRQGH